VSVAIGEICVTIVLKSADKFKMTQKFRLWFAEPLHHSESSGHRTLAERFAVPHSFPPNLSLPEALVRVGGALARILSGSLLFAVWGVLSARAWAAMPNQFWRAASILPLAFLFLMPFAALMAGIAAMVRAASPKRH
jgi:hypothetical protein